MQQKGIITQDQKIIYTIAGKGPAVVFLHGFGADRQIWKQQVNHLQKTYCVITPDLPGIGESSLTASLSMDTIAAAIKEILNNEQINKVTVIGHSMGGYVALAFAEKYPETLQALGLFHSTAVADNEEKKETRAKGIEFTKKHGAATFLETTAPKMFAASTPKENIALYQSFMNQLPKMSTEAVISYYEAMMQRPDRSSILQQIQIPVLFIFGEQDEIIPLQKTIEQASLANSSSVYILKKSGHLGMIEEPESTNQILEEFLSDI